MVMQEEYKILYCLYDILLSNLYILHLFLSKSIASITALVTNIVLCPSNGMLKGKLTYALLPCKVPSINKLAKQDNHLLF